MNQDVARPVNSPSGTAQVISLAPTAGTGYQKKPHFPTRKNFSFRRLVLAFSATLSCLQAAPDTVDSTFAGSAGQLFEPDNYGGVSSVHVQPDGKILFGSNEMAATLYRGQPNQEAIALPLVRINPDGTVDQTFFADNEPNGSNSGIYYDGQGFSEVHALGQLSDGKIIAAGVMQGVRTGTLFEPGTFLRSNSIVSFNADGTINTSFQTAGTMAWVTGGLNYIKALSIQPDDKIIAVGGFSGFRDTVGGATIANYGIVRLQPHGAVDTSFQFNPYEFGAPADASLLRGWFRECSLDSAGKLLVVGELVWGPAYPETGKRSVIGRLNPDGTRDSSFQPAIPSQVTSYNHILVEPSGKIMVIGSDAANNSWMGRLHPDGSLDSSFNLDSSLSYISANPLRIDSEGRYLLVTRGSGYANDHLIRVLSNGAIDPTFNAYASYVNSASGPGFGSFGTFITAPSGKIYSGSYFDRVNGTTTVKIVAFEGDSAPSSPGIIQFSSSTFSASEQQGVLRVAVTRAAGVTGAASATLSLNHGSTSAADFGSFATTITFADGFGGTQYIDLPLTKDLLAESNESATLTLGGVTGASLGARSSAAITIIDADSAPIITRDPATLFAPPGSPFSLSVGMTSGATPVTYQWFKNGFAIAGAILPVYSISSAEAASHNGSYTVAVTNPIGTTVSAVATVTVKNPAILSFVAAAVSAVESDGTLALTIRRSGSGVGAVSAEIALIAGTATSPDDYTDATTTVSWADGDTNDKVVNITLINDAIAEPQKAFQASLQNLSLDAILGAHVTAQLTLLDDDSGPAITRALTSIRAVNGWPASLTVVAQSQTSLSYQWYKNGTLMPAQTGATLAFSPVSLSDYAYYSVAVTNTAGTVISGPVEVGQRPNPLDRIVLDLTVQSYQYNGTRARPHGGYLIYGSFTSIPTSTGSITAKNILRTLANGKIDTNFLPAPNGTVRQVLELADGSVIMAGDFTSVGVVSTPGGFARIMPNGTVDANFVANLPTLGVASDLKLGDDGWIYITHNQGVTRIQSNGVADPSFSSNLLAAFQSGSNYYSLEFAPGGGFYLSGILTLSQGVPGQTNRRLVKLNPNGTYDSTWKYTNASIAFNYFGVQSDGKIVISSASGTLTRLHPDGTTDNTFTTITGMYGTNFAVAADDTIYIVNGAGAAANIRHFLANGTADTNFNNGSNPTANNTITSIKALSDGTISLDGSFAQFNGVAATRPTLITGELRSIMISSHPLSQIVDPGADVALAVVASSVLPLSYQWSKDGVILPGKNLPTLALDDVTSADTGNYSVAVSSGSLLVAAAPAQFTVRDAPAIFSTPADFTQLLGPSLSLAIGWVGVEPATFEWRRNGVVVAGQTTATLSIAAPTAADSGIYTLHISNALGAVTSTPIVVNLIPDPAAIIADYIPATGGNPNVKDVIPVPSGAYVVEGLSSQIIHPSGTYHTVLERIDTVGNILEPFTANPNTNLTGVTRDTATGNLYLYGYNMALNGTNSLRLARMAADGTVDTAFTTTTTNTLTSLNIQPFAVAIDADGRILVGGNNQLVRFNLDGTLHVNLNTSAATMGAIREIAVLPNGKILLAGSNKMRRLLADGSIDSTFVFPTLPGGATLNQFEFDPAGNIIIPSIQSTGQAIYRLSPEGALLQTIDFPYLTYNYINRLHVTPSGTMLVSHENGKRLLRLTAEGILDPQFTLSGTGFNSSINAIASAADGSVWIGGSFTTFNGNNTRAVIRLNGTPLDIIINSQPAALTIDTAATAQFTVTATGSLGTTPTYQWRKNGIPLVNGGKTSGATSATLTLANSQNADEANYDVVVSNDSTGFTLVSKPASLTVLREPELLTLTSAQNLEVGQALSLSVSARGAGTIGYRWFRNGEVIIGQNTAALSIGSASEVDAGLYTVEISNVYGNYLSAPIAVSVILPPAGVVLGLPYINFNSTVNAILPLPDGRTLVGGIFTTVVASGISSSIPRLALLDATGNLVTTFNLSPNNAVNALSLMPDGGVLIGGNFTSIGGLTRNRVARLLPNLTVDATWSVGTGPNTSVTTIERSANGYYLGGSFLSFNGDSKYPYLCRILEDGTLDLGFTPVLLGGINRIVRDGDGIIVGGNFTIKNTVTNANQIGIVRLLSNGAHDTAFTSGFTSATAVYDIVALPGGKWLAGGQAGRLSRFQANGTLDTTWLTFANQDIRALALQRDGSIVVGGNFTTIAGQAANRIARLKPNGELDSAFLQGTGASHLVTCLAIGALGSTHVGGDFTSYRDLPFNRYARINGTPHSIGIANQPATQIVNPASSAQFSVSVRATDTISYQWRRNGVPVTNGGKFSGVTTSTLTIANTDDSDEAIFDVIVTHNGDSTSITSSSANLIVLGAPEVQSQPIAVTTEVGLGATFFVTARGVGPLSYQWFSGSAPLVNGPGISGATSKVLTLSNLKVADSNNIFVRITNDLGFVDSTSAALLVEKLPANRDRSVMLPTSIAGVNDVLPFADGSYLVGGQFTTVGHSGGTANRKYLAKINANGIPDVTVPQINGSGIVEIIRPAADGKIYIAGGFTSINIALNTNVTRNRIARLNADLTLDTSFNPVGTGPNNSVLAVLPLADGKVMIAGDFTSVNSVVKTAYVARLNADGSVDTSFESQAVIGVRDIVSAGDGTFWLAHPNTYSGTSGLVRITDTGAKASGFTYTGSMTANRLLPQSDGTVIALSSNYPYLQKVQSAGPLVPSWPNTGGILPGAITAGVTYANSTTILGGNFTSYSGVSSARLAAINADGSLDASFNIKSGLNGTSTRIRLDQSGRLWVCGSFTTYQGEAVPGLIVLNGLVADPYAAFVAALPPGEQGANDDPDADGVENLIEFIYHTNPANASSRPPSIPLGSVNSGAALNATYGLSLDIAKTYRVVEVELPKNLQGATATLEATQDLTYSGDATTTEIGNRTDNGSTEIRRYLISPAIEDANALFWRLSVTR